MIKQNKTKKLAASDINSVGERGCRLVIGGVNPGKNCSYGLRQQYSIF